jgi:peptidoglycan/xylan/chitin deacetylase (PgdA/CDA1 family)
MHTREYPKRRLMTLEQLKDIHQRGVCLGTHTRSHACLPELNQAQLDTEIRDSKADLEAAIGDTVQHFAYPFGQYNEAARNTVEAAGYATACSTRSGFNRADVDPFQLRRIEVYGSDSLARFQKKLRFGVNDMPWYFTPRYYLKRVGQKLGLN